AFRNFQKFCLSTLLLTDKGSGKSNLRPALQSFFPLLKATLSEDALPAQEWQMNVVDKVLEATDQIDAKQIA
ncbi:unnamed protein product, partial [Amoebophrya sp. A120]